MTLMPEKRARIMNAAIDEFAKNGYEHASTNEIIKAAGISKGSLFHYFGSKKELYLYLLDAMLDVLTKICDDLDWEERDLFTRFREIVLIKKSIIKRYPEAFRFITAAKCEESPEVQELIGEKIENCMNDAYQRIFEDIDYTKFREDIDIEKAVKIIIWTVNSFAEEERLEKGSLVISKKQMLDFDSYMRVLQRCFYKDQESAEV